MSPSLFHRTRERHDAHTRSALPAFGWLALLVAALLATDPAVASASDGDTANAVFSGRVTGSSTFTEALAMITVSGSYAGLTPGRTFFTVLYPNGRCDPVAAFPVGPFRASALGVAVLPPIVLPAVAPVTGGVVDVGRTGSISVRRGDTAADLDGDGVRGQADVVAVPGKPWIGLVQCNRAPRVVDVP